MSTPSSLLQIKKLSNARIKEKYMNQNNYPETCIDVLVHNRNSHYNSLFKDCMLYDYIDEFLKRFYFNVESLDRIPKMSKYYINYLTFFCKPYFRDFEVNTILKRYGDNRAELYYVRNFGKGEETETQRNTDYDKEKENIKTLLTTTVKEKINHNSMTQLSIETNKFDSRILSELHLFEEIENRSGILTRRSNKDESLVNILFHLDPVNIDEHFLVKDKMNFKKTIHSINTNYTSNVDKTTTKDYSTKTHKENPFLDLNRIEIKEMKTIETNRENRTENRTENKSENRTENKTENTNEENSSHNSNISPVKYSRMSEFKNLKVPCNHLSPNIKITQPKDILPQSTETEILHNPKTRNKQIVHQKSNEFTITQATCSNIYATTIKNKTVIHNKFLEEIQNEALKALQKIKKTKLEFKNIKKENSSNKVVYVETCTNKENKENKETKENANNLLTLNEMLRLTLNDKNSRNKPRNETKTDCKMTTKTQLNLNDFTSNRSKINEQIKTSEVVVETLPKSDSKSKSPINKENYKNFNVLNNIAENTKTFSRNKNLNLLGIHTNNTKINHEKKEKDKDSGMTVLKSFKSYKSFKKDKSLITQTVHLNIPTPNIEELEKKIFGTFMTNSNISKNDLSSKNCSVKKVLNEKSSKMSTKQSQILKTINNLVQVASKSNQANNLKSNNKNLTRNPISSNLNSNITNTFSNINVNPNTSNKMKNLVTATSKKKIPSYDFHTNANANKKVIGKHEGGLNLFSTVSLLKK